MVNTYAIVEESSILVNHTRISAPWILRATRGYWAI